MLTADEKAVLSCLINKHDELAEAYRLGVEQERKRCAEDVARLRQRVNNQRTELRRLNRYLGPYWTGFRRGLAVEAECKLRGIMNAAFGHEKVQAAEHAAIERGE